MAKGILTGSMRISISEEKERLDSWQEMTRNLTRLNPGKKGIGITFLNGPFSASFSFTFGLCKQHYSFATIKQALALNVGPVH